MIRLISDEGQYPEGDYPLRILYLAAALLAPAALSAEPIPPVPQFASCAVVFEVKTLHDAEILGKGPASHGPSDARLRVLETGKDGAMCDALNAAQDIHMNAVSTAFPDLSLKAGDRLFGAVVRFDVSRGGTFNIRPEYWHVFLIETGAPRRLRFEGLGLMP